MIWPLAVDTWGDEEKQAAIACINNGERTMGRHVREFEEQFADYAGAKYAVMVNSGSSANLLLISALKYMHELDGPVALPALGWSTTYSPFIQLGIPVRLVDIDPQTLNMDLSLLPPDIPAMPIHVLGNPLGVSRANCEYCRKSGAHPDGYVVDEGDLLPPCPMCSAGRLWIEDCCESLGAGFKPTMKGIAEVQARIGLQGAGGTFSFFFSHHITTGEGGMVITDDEDLYHAMLCLRAHGWTRDLPQQKPSKAWTFDYPGFNLRPMEMQGAVGKVQLQYLPRFVRQRRENALLLEAAIMDRQWLSLQRGPASSVGHSSWMAFALTVKPGTVPRDVLVDALNRCGIETRPVLSGNIAWHGIAKWLGNPDPASFPQADYIQDNSFMIGNSHLPLTDVQLEVLSTVLDLMESNYL